MSQPGSLYVVATPVGNLADCSPRAVETLRQVDLIACEDTRHTRKLLNHFDISTPTLSYHEHNEEERTPQLIRELEGGRSLALVSDAGTPLLSDPGYRLVRSCRLQSLSVIPVPGPFAGAAAASVSGLATDRLLFAGFLESKRSSLLKQLEEVSRIEATLVFYLSPHRLHETLAAAAGVLGGREAFLIREMTKLHEESFFGSLPELAERLAERESRGEYTLLVAGAPSGAEIPTAVDLKAYVEGLMKVRGLSRRDASRQAAEELELSSRDVYQASLSD